MTNYKIKLFAILMLPLAIQSAEVEIDYNWQLLDSAASGNLAGVENALNNGAKIDAVKKSPNNLNPLDNFDKTPLYLAVINDHIDVAKRLIFAGASVDLAISLTALFFKDKKKQFEFVGKLIQVEAQTVGIANRKNSVPGINVKLAVVITDCNKQLEDAILKNKLELVEEALKNGADVNYVGYQNASVLHNAVAIGNTDIVRTMLEAKALVNAHWDQTLVTPLFIAASLDKFEIADLLIKAGAMINIQDNRGETALMMASKYGQIKTVALLLEAGAELNFRDENYNTAYDVIGYSLEYGKKAPGAGGGRVVVIDIDSLNFICSAAKYGQSGDLVNLKKLVRNTPYNDDAENMINLVKNIQDSIHKRINHATSLIAPVTGLPDAYSQLISHMAYGYEYDSTPKLLKYTQQLKRAAKANNLKDVIEALDYADLESSYKNGRTALHWAAQWGHNEMVKVLLGAKANVMAKNKDATTSMHIAASRGHVEVIKSLIDAGAIVNAKDKWDRSPLRVAAQNDQSNVVRLLLGLINLPKSSDIIKALELGYMGMVIFLLNAKQGVSWHFVD